MGKCTVPRLLGFKEWFDKHFDSYCQKHDAAYKATLNPFKKLWADVLMLWGMGKHTLGLWRDVVLANASLVGALIVLPTGATVYWILKRGREVARGEWKGRK